VLFVAVATNLRDVAQVRRLLWALTISSLIMSAYGAGQYWGVDSFRAAPPGGRIPLTFGNPIFGAAYLMMTIPLTLGLWQGWQKRLSFPLHLALGIALVMPQVVVLALTLSRGSMIGMAFSLAVFGGLSFWVFGLKRAQRPATILAVGVSLALVSSFLPIPGVPQVGNDLVNRLSTIRSSFTPEGGGLSSRYTIWRYSATALGSVPWADSDTFPELPNLTAKPLRRLVGFGPDLFRYAISYAERPEDPTHGPGHWQHGHNFLIHTAVELGLFGVVAYLSLIAAVSVALYQLLREARSGAIPESLGYVIVGLSAVLAGRGLEQMAGKAQIADMALSWILAGVVVAITGMRAHRATTAPAAEPGSAPRKRAQQNQHNDGISLISSRVVTNTTVAVLIVFAVVLWSQTIVGTVRSSLLVGEALRAREAGQGYNARTLMGQAVLIAPDDVVQRGVHAGSLVLWARAEEDPAMKLSLLLEAYEIVEPVLERNPMAFRSRWTASEISADIMLLDPTFVPTAVRNREIDAALSPWLWKPRVSLSRTLFQIGLLDEAQEALNGARELGAGSENQDVLYLEERIQFERANIMSATKTIQSSGTQ
jgi:O-antigen ligase